jgi:hypothetical protein
MTTLSQRLDEYLAVRRSLGYDLSLSGRVLRGFTAFADHEGADHITVDLFLRWKDANGVANNDTWSARLGMVRIFAGIVIPELPSHSRHHVERMFQEWRRPYGCHQAEHDTCERRMGVHRQEAEPQNGAG